MLGGLLQGLRFRCFVFALAIILQGVILPSSCASEHDLADPFLRNVLPRILKPLGLVDTYALRQTSVRLSKIIKPLQLLTDEEITQYIHEGKFDAASLKNFCRRNEAYPSVLTEFATCLIMNMLPDNKMEAKHFVSLYPCMKILEIADQFHDDRAADIRQMLMKVARLHTRLGMSEAYRFAASFGSAQDKINAGHKFNRISVYEEDKTIDPQPEEAMQWYRAAVIDIHNTGASFKVSDLSIIMFYFDHNRQSSFVTLCYQLFKGRVPHEFVPSHAILMALKHFYVTNKHNKLITAFSILNKNPARTILNDLWEARCNIRHGLDEDSLLSQPERNLLLEEGIKNYNALFEKSGVKHPNNEDLKKIYLIDIDYMDYVRALVRLKRYKEATHFFEQRLLIEDKYIPFSGFLRDIGLAYFKMGQFTGQFHGCGYIAKKAALLKKNRYQDILFFATLAAYAQNWNLCLSLINNVSSTCIYSDPITKFTLAYIYSLNPAWQPMAEYELAHLERVARNQKSQDMFLEEVLIDPIFYTKSSIILPFFKRMMNLTRAPGSQTVGVRNAYYEEKGNRVQPLLEEEAYLEAEIVQRYLWHSSLLYKVFDSPISFQMVLEHGSFDHILALFFYLMKQDISYLPWGLNVERKLISLLQQSKAQACPDLARAHHVILRSIIREIDVHPSYLGRLLVTEQGSPHEIMQLARRYMARFKSGQIDFMRVALETYYTLYLKVGQLQWQGVILWQRMVKNQKSTLGQLLQHKLFATEFSVDTASLELMALKEIDRDIKMPLKVYVQDKLLTKISYEQARQLPMFQDLSEQQYRTRSFLHQGLLMKVYGSRLNVLSKTTLAHIKGKLLLRIDPMTANERRLIAHLLHTISLKMTHQSIAHTSPALLPLSQPIYGTMHAWLHEKTLLFKELK